MSKACELTEPRAVPSICISSSPFCPLFLRSDAATIANNVLQKVLAGLAPGRKIADICEEGDNLIQEACNKIYQKKKVEKGIAFPTCVSVNEVIGHHSPLKSESPELKEGDVVKVYVFYPQLHSTYMPLVTISSFQFLSIPFFAVILVFTLTVSAPWLPTLSFSQLRLLLVPLLM